MYITQFLANFDPSLLSHFVTHPGAPSQSTSHISDSPPPFFVGLAQKPGKKPPVQILSQLFAGVIVHGGFCLGWFLSVPPSVRIHLLQQKVKHHFKFHVL